MTPEEAIALGPGTTDGPWEWREHNHTPYNVEGPDQDYQSLGTADNHALQTQDAEGYASWFVASDEDKALIAAAPDMRATIAAQTWEYALDYREPGSEVWESSVGGWKQSMEAVRDERESWLKNIPDNRVRVVRRPVGPVEVVE